MVNLLLLATDIADGGNWWFYYPLLAWGAGLAIHAIVAFGPGVSAFDPRQAPAAAAPEPRTAPVESSTPERFEGLVGEAEARVAKLWRTARLIPTPAVRDRAFAVCAAADRVAEAMAQRPPDAQTVRYFLDRYLEPTEAVLDRYVRLATRGVAAAEPALAKVENQDLPLLETRLDQLYQRLHRGDLIDLEVASQMLEFDLDSAPPKPNRSIPS